jgi:hypothetical protein
MIITRLFLHQYQIVIEHHTLMMLRWIDDVVGTARTRATIVFVLHGEQECGADAPAAL